MVKFLFKSPSCPSRVSFRFLLLKQQRSKARTVSPGSVSLSRKRVAACSNACRGKKGRKQYWAKLTYWSVRRYRRTKAVRKWVAVTSHPFFGSGFCWPGSSSLPLIAHAADDGTCMYTHEPHARTYFWSGIRKEHCETSPILATVFSTTREGWGEGVSCSFFFPPSLFLPLARASSCRGQKIFVKRQTWSRTKDLRYPSCSSRIIYFSL